MGKINIGEYFEKGTFFIPNYQRGYKWPVLDKVGKSALNQFIENLTTAFNRRLPQYFIEAVTVVEAVTVEENHLIILVDGQQRTTSLFLLFAALDDFNTIRNKLNYDIRHDSASWLNHLVENGPNANHILPNNEDAQDIHYFKIAISLIKDKIVNLDKKQFVIFLKEKVFLLYNKVDKEKAVNIFMALNGLKAVMKDEELIKSALLIKSSSNDLINKIEWKRNEQRSRLARNWDKWLYWWNQNEVSEYFGISKSDHPLFYLLVTYWNINKNNEDGKLKFSFENFNLEFIGDYVEAKKHFEGLRKLQKTFEDLYNDNIKHNFFGLILKTSSNKETALQYFLNPNLVNKKRLEEYAKYSLVNATHSEIIDNNLTYRNLKAENAIILVNEKLVYCDENGQDFKDGRKGFAYGLLMLLNILEDNSLIRKFDFSIWGKRSLEHIFPKSKSHKLIFDDIGDNKKGSIHCIGNLVLLYANDNSKFNDKDFLDKKNTYFDTSEELMSRNLLHTISVFAKSEWGVKEILENKKNIINRLEKYYGFK